MPGIIPSADPGTSLLLPVQMPASLSLGNWWVLNWWLVLDFLSAQAQDLGEFLT